MLIEFSKLVRGAPRSKVFEWLTNYQSLDPQISSVRLRQRQVIERSADIVRLEESGVLMMPFDAKITVKLHPPDWYEANSIFTLGVAHNEYRLTEVPEGTSLNNRFDIKVNGWKQIIAPVAKPYFQHQIEKEWDDYVRTMEKDLA